jgi:hypothetical protein
MIIIGIDPGSTHSGMCIVTPIVMSKMPNIVRAEKIENAELTRMMQQPWAKSAEFAIEGFACQGRPVGESSIQTMYFIGEIKRIAIYEGLPLAIYTRREYGQWITAGGKLNDATLRAGLESVYGPSAKKNDPLYLLRGASDKRSAFAIAKYHEFKRSQV